MSRLSIVTRDNSPTASKPLLDLVYKRLGTVPNLSRLIGMSPGVLRAFAAFQGGLAKAIGAKMRARISYGSRSPIGRHCRCNTSICRPSNAPATGEKEHVRRLRLGRPDFALQPDAPCTQHTLPP